MLKSEQNPLSFTYPRAKKKQKVRTTKKRLSKTKLPQQDQNASDQLEAPQTLPGVFLPFGFPGIAMQKSEKHIFCVKWAKLGEVYTHIWGLGGICKSERNGRNSFQKINPWRPRQKFEPEYAFLVEKTRILDFQSRTNPIKSVENSRIIIFWSKISFFSDFWLRL